jgi:hypothetical protein
MLPQESSQFHVMLFPYKRRHSSWFSESYTSYFSTRHKPQATKFIALLFAKIIGKRRYWQTLRGWKLCRAFMLLVMQLIKVNEAASTGPEIKATSADSTFSPEGIRLFYQHGVDRRPARARELNATHEPDDNEVSARNGRTP